MKEHLLLQVGDTIKIEGQEGIWKVTETPFHSAHWAFPPPQGYTAIREGHGVIFTWHRLDQEAVDTKVKKLVEGPV